MAQEVLPDFHQGKGDSRRLFEPSSAPGFEEYDSEPAG